MEFIWHDGGRARCGFVGQTGDCVTRSIAIATGQMYRHVYNELSEASLRTARHGIANDVSAEYLRERGWTHRPVDRFSQEDLPKGVLLLSFRTKSERRSGHLSCLIDHTIYDTWNPFEDTSFALAGYWQLETTAGRSDGVIPAPAAVHDAAEVLTQEQYDKILNRVRALDRTASNHAATEGEVRNALRMMQNLMRRHNLSRSDIIDEDDVTHVGMTRRACPLNGSKACRWESMLAWYIINEILPTVQFYKDRSGHRTLFWFYGPVEDVQNALQLFDELLLTIATAAQIKYRGYSRGSGASYAEGYVDGLPRSYRDPETSNDAIMSEQALIRTRMMAVHDAARRWLDVECDIRLQSGGRSRRTSHDASAHHAGRKDGASHDVSGAYLRKRITQ